MARGGEKRERVSEKRTINKFVKNQIKQICLAAQQQKEKKNTQRKKKKGGTYSNISQQEQL